MRKILKCNWNVSIVMTMVNMNVIVKIWKILLINLFANVTNVAWKLKCTVSKHEADLQGKVGQH